MSTKKVKNIESTVNPFNPKTQHEDYIQFKMYELFMSSLKADSWRDCLGNEMTEEEVNDVISSMDIQTEYITDRIADRVNRMILFRKFYTDAHSTYDIDSPTVKKDINFRKNARMDYFTCEIIQDLCHLIARIIAKTSVKAVVKTAGTPYMFEVLNGHRPHDFEDIASVAYQTIMSWLDISPYYFSMKAEDTRRVRRQNVVAWNHVMNESDYTMETKTLYEWLRSDTAAYIQSMRGVRVPVTRIEKRPVKNKKTGKIEMVEKRVYTSVYYPMYEIDGAPIESANAVLWRMKATAANTDSYDSPVNPFIELLAKRMREEKLLTKKQVTFVSEWYGGDSYRTIAGAHGCHESTVRESVKSANKKVVNWLKSKNIHIKQNEDGKIIAVDTLDE